MAVSSFATTTKKPTKRHTTHAAVTSSKHPATTASKHKGATGKNSKTSKSRASARRSYQQSPTPERYKEIQQALASQGYFHGEANGEWGADSQDALRRFQAEQNLTADGKLSSMSLIALGLGPKRLSAQSHAQPAPEPPKPEVQK